MAERQRQMPGILSDMIFCTNGKSPSVKLEDYVTKRMTKLMRVWGGTIMFFVIVIFWQTKWD